MTEHLSYAPMPNPKMNAEKEDENAPLTMLSFPRQKGIHQKTSAKNFFDKCSKMQCRPRYADAR
jgi:hypothetical protein